MEREKNNQKLIWSILVLAILLVILVGSTYAYFTVSIRDERNYNNNGGNKMKTCEIAEATIIKNIPDSVGTIEATSMLPGHKEIAGFSVTAKGQNYTSSSFQIIYDITENTFAENDLKVSVYKRETSLEITTNYFECTQTMDTGNGVQFYERCKEKEIGSLVQETILSKDNSITIGKDTIVVKSEEQIRYYYVVLEFLNKDEEQNSSMDSRLKGTIRVENIGEKIPYKEDILNGMDPVIKDELVPITIEQDGTVYRADESDSWYSYETQEWANAVILKNNEAYCPGEVIPEENIESYFVWIPKYRYQLWDLGNYSGLTKVDNSKVHTIPVLFGDYNTRDEVSGECTTPMTSGNIGNCSVGDYMTHPAFLSIPSTGFWVGKFETSKGNTNEDNSINPSGVEIKPNVSSWRNIQVANAFYTSYKYQRNLDSHMMKNTEWGAVAYLQHSKYGSGESVRFNNNSNYITGYASTKEPTCGWTNDNRACNKYGTTSDITLPYNTETGYLASTTGNITGIYDMAGGAWEYVMGVMTDTNGNPLSGRNASLNSGFTGGYGEGGSLAAGYSWPEEKYYDKYSYGTSYSEYTRRILGDAMGEMGPFQSVTYGSQTGRQISSWYVDSANFVHSYKPWFQRGYAIHNGSETGVFAFSHTEGAVLDNAGFRVIMTPVR